nr:RING-H2 finger protein ATL39-like [Ipomoea batatas]
MLGSGMNLITTVIGFGMSATFIVFVCTRLICGRLRRRQSRQMFEIESRIDLELTEHRNNGLDPVVVAAIPTLKFHPEAFSSSEDTQCTICLAEYQEKEVLRIMPKCGHTFHLSCIDIWLRKQSTCPVCRLSVRNSSERKQRHPAMLGQDQSFDSSEVSMGHSRQLLLLPTAERSQADASNTRDTESVAIEIEPAGSAEAAAAPRS